MFFSSDIVSDCSEAKGHRVSLFAGAHQTVPYIVVMAAGSRVTLEEYLATAYDPDVEYVDGALEARNGGDWLHSLIQRNIIVTLRVKYPRLFAVPELRTQVASTRFRFPISGSSPAATNHGCLPVG